MTPLHPPFHPHRPNVHDHDPNHAPVWRPLHLSRHVPAHTHLMTIQRLRSSSPSPSPPPLHPYGHCHCIHRQASALYVIHRFGSHPITGYHVPKTPPATVVSPSSYPRLMSSQSPFVLTALSPSPQLQKKAVPQSFLLRQSFLLL